MNKLFYLFLALTGLIATSCQQDTLRESRSDKTEVFNFVYDGVEYSSEYSSINGTSIALLDPSVNKLYQQLMALPELSTLIDHNTNISEFFDNSDALKDALKQKAGPIDTVTRNDSVYAELLFLVPSCTLYTPIGGAYSVYHEQAHLWGDYEKQISSYCFRAQTDASHVAIFYENIDFGGKSLAILSRCDANVGDLNSDFIPLNNFVMSLSEHLTWDQQISSFQVFPR